MEMLKLANLGLRFLLELCALAALGYGGAHAANHWLGKIALGAGLPLAAAVLWGTFVAPKASIPVPIGYRLLLELLIFGSAAYMLYRSDRSFLAACFIVILAVNSVLLLVWKQ